MLSSKLNFAPLPELSLVAKIINKNNKKVSNLNKYLGNNHLNFFWLSKSTWALYTIAKCRLHSESKNSINIWIPDYFCNSTLNLLRSLEVNISFYPINKDRYPNIIECKKMAKENSPDLILFVNYFGQDFFSQELYDIAKDYNAWLIEDSAHCLQPNTCNKNADLILSSPHKLLPIPDGAILIIKENGPNKISEEILRNFKTTYNAITYKKHLNRFREYKWLIKRLLQKLGLSSQLSRVKFNDEESSSSFNEFYNPVVSSLAKKLFFEGNFDFENESIVRRFNHNAWKDNLKKVNTLNHMIEINPVSYVPYLAEIKFANRTQAEKIFIDFQKAQIPVSTWPDLAPEVLANPSRHFIAIEMRFKSLFLPVHSSINPDLIKLSLKRIGLKGV